MCRPARGRNAKAIEQLKRMRTAFIGHMKLGGADCIDKSMSTARGIGVHGRPGLDKIQKEEGRYPAPDADRGESVDHALARHAGHVAWPMHLAAHVGMTAHRMRACFYRRPSWASGRPAHLRRLEAPCFYRRLSWVCHLLVLWVCMTASR